MLKEENGIVHHVKSGDIMIHKPHLPISVYSDKKGLHLYINLELQVMGDTLLHYQDMPGVLRLQDSAPFHLAFEKLVEQWNDAQSAIRDMRLISLSADLVSSVFQVTAEQRDSDRRASEIIPPRRTAALDQRFYKVIEYMTNHTNENLTCDFLAKMVHMHPSAFNKSFKAIYGVTPKLMFCNLRLYKAKQLLEDENLTLEAIAEDCGYYDAAYFIRIFQQAYRQTPGEYRRNLNVFGRAGELGKAGMS